MRILINASTSIGDSLYCSFIYPNLHQRYPHATMHVLCWHPMVDFYQSFGYIKRVIAYDHVQKDNAFALFLLRPRVDLYVDMQHTPDSADIARTINAPERIGINPASGTHDVYTQVIIPHKNEHLYDCVVRGFRDYWGTEPLDTSIPIATALNDEYMVEDLLRREGILPDTPYIVIHPGAKGDEKLWSIDKWCELVDYLQSRQFAVVLAGSRLTAWGGAPIRDRESCAAIAQRMGGKVVNMAGKMQKFMHLATLIRGAVEYIGLDTGPTHLAALLGVPVIELYKYTDENTFCLWRARGTAVTVLPKSDMNELTVAEVITAFETQRTQLV